MRLLLICKAAFFLAAAVFVGSLASGFGGLVSGGFCVLVLRFPAARNSKRNRAFAIAMIFA